ncbi:MAG: hypothetical protein KAS59_02345 [Alphaproteobacteria bacterium]|nr:hypothetical protein [Alphaproteobacteria bacterium]
MKTFKNKKCLFIANLFDEITCGLLLGNCLQNFWIGNEHMALLSAIAFCLWCISSKIADIDIEKNKEKK